MRLPDTAAWLTKLTSLLLPSPPPQPSSPPPFRIAIIGAGISGATAANRLHALAAASPATPVTLTLFDAADRLGGRIHTVPHPHSTDEHLEAGAATFAPDDTCLARALANVSLRALPAGPAAVWADGGWRVDPVCRGVAARGPAPEGTWGAVGGWVERARFVLGLGWRFVWAVPAWEVAVSRSRARWQQFGAGDEPFASVRGEFERVGLGEDVRTSLAGSKRFGSYATGLLKTFIKPCVRAQTGTSDTAHISMLAALLTSYWGRQQDLSIEGGNVRLIERLVEQSGATVHLNTKVTLIRKGDTSPYQLLTTTPPSTSSPSSPSSLPSPEPLDFDAILLATPLDTQQTLLSPSLHLTHPPARTHHTPLHVTHFATPGRAIPELSTYRIAHASGPAGPARGFLEMSAPADAVARVLSAERLADADVRALGGLEDEGWVERAVWGAGAAVFAEGGGAGGGEVEVAPGLYYLGGGEGVLGTVEMGCRMGWNAAGLVARRWEGEKAVVEGGEGGEEGGKGEL